VPFAFRVFYFHNYFLYTKTPPYQSKRCLCVYLILFVTGKEVVEQVTKAKAVTFTIVARVCYGYEGRCWCRAATLSNPGVCCPWSGVVPVSCEPELLVALLSVGEVILLTPGLTIVEKYRANQKEVLVYIQKSPPFWAGILKVRLV
jgi:hypothetical protein